MNTEPSTEQLVGMIRSAQASKEHRILRMKD